MAKKNTLRDVAREAGVSQATASLVLNGKPGISEATRQKVLGAVDQLEYKRSSTDLHTEDTVGLLIGKTADEVDVHTFDGIIISAILRELAYSPVKIELLSLQSSLDNEDGVNTKQLFLQKMANWKGAIFLHSIMLSDPGILNQLNFPIILIDSFNTYPQYYQIDNDNIGGAYKGVRHLIELGHRKIAYISTPIQTPFGYMTFTGYKKAMAESKLPIYSHMIEETAPEQFSPQQGYQAIERIMNQDSENLPTAVFCSSDQLAYGVLQYMEQTGCRIAVTGMDDMPLSALTRPPLTTVRIGISELGAQAARMLVSLVDGNYTGPQYVVLDNELVIRESTFPAEAAPNQ